MRIRRRHLPLFVAALAGMCGAIPAASAAGSGGNTERFIVVNTSTANGPTTGPISATGPIHALGKDVPVDDNHDKFVFPKGTLLVTHHRTSGTQHFDKVTCTAQITEQGTYTITGGTKAYAGATGRGTYSLSGIFIACRNKPPLAASFIIRAAGPLRL